MVRENKKEREGFVLKKPLLNDSKTVSSGLYPVSYLYSSFWGTGVLPFCIFFPSKVDSMENKAVSWTITFYKIMGMLARTIAVVQRINLFWFPVQNLCIKLEKSTSLPN